MTSPEEAVSPKSPPFVISSSFQTANDVLFGGRSNQPSNTGKPIIFLYKFWRICCDSDLNNLYTVHTGKMYEYTFSSF